MVEVDFAGFDVFAEELVVRADVDKLWPLDDDACSESLERVLTFVAEAVMEILTLGVLYFDEIDMIVELPKVVLCCDEVAIAFSPPLETAIRVEVVNDVFLLVKMVKVVLYFVTNELDADLLPLDTVDEIDGLLMDVTALALFFELDSTSVLLPVETEEELCFDEVEVLFVLTEELFERFTLNTLFTALVTTDDATNLDDPLLNFAEFVVGLDELTVALSTTSDPDDVALPVEDRLVATVIVLVTAVREIVVVLVMVTVVVRVVRLVLSLTALPRTSWLMSRR